MEGGLPARPAVGTDDPSRSDHPDLGVGGVARRGDAGSVRHLAGDLLPAFGLDVVATVDELDRSVEPAEFVAVQICAEASWRAFVVLARGRWSRSPSFTGQCR